RFHSILTAPPTHPLRPIIPNNACTLCITAAAGTELAGASSSGTVIIVPIDRSLHPKGLHPPRGVAASWFPPLRKIPHCCRPSESGPCFSSSVAVRPLRPATDHCLGEPLPHQLSNQPRPPPSANCSFDYQELHLVMLCGISPGFPRLSPTVG